MKIRLVPNMPSTLDDISPNGGVKKLTKTRSHPRLKEQTDKIKTNLSLIVRVAHFLSINYFNIYL